MSVNRQDVERIVTAVPGFRITWEKFLEEWEAEGPLPWYIAMSELAHYIVDNYAKGTTAEFADFFATVESFLNNPDPELQGLIAVGLFEDIQNIASHRTFGAVPFRQWLGPRSLVAWGDVNAFTQRAAAWTARQKPRWWQFWRRRGVFDSEKALSQVENPELRKIIEADYRKKE
jgi:hypothetical protein